MKKTPRVCGLVLLRSGVSARGPVPCCRGRDALFRGSAAVGRDGEVLHLTYSSRRDDCLAAIESESLLIIYVQ